MSTAIAYLIVFAIALGTALLTTPFASWLARRLNVVDRPGGRRQQHGVVPRLGGIAIFTAFAAAAIAAQFLPVPRFDPNELVRFVGLMLGASLIFGIGLLDDWIEFGPIPLYISQLAAGAIAVLFWIFIETVNDPFTGQQLRWGYVFTVTVTLLWLGVMMNTVNFLDGLDGLSAGVSLIAGLMLFANSAFRVHPAQVSVSLLPLALVGACLGFLVYNFNPARVFMGSSGAYFLGFALGTMSIIGGAKMATITLVMGLPLLDFVWQIANRIVHGRNPMHGDRGHLHFRLVDRGFSQRKIVLFYYLFCAFFGALTLITTSRLFKLIVLICMIVIVFVGFAVLSRVNNKPAIESGDLT